MGRQVNFYMYGADEAQFVQFVLSQNLVVLLASPTETAVPVTLDRLPNDDPSRILHSDLYFWRQGDPVTMRRTEIRAGPLEGQILYFVDELSSSVIQFLRSYLRGDIGVLTRGRIWAEMWRLEEGQFIDKGESFRAWYENIAGWIRRHYEKIRAGSFCYVGPDARRWYEAGGRFQP